MLIVVLVYSCSNGELVEEKADHGEGTKLLFFSDEADVEREVSYYDAILEIRKTYPELVNELKVVTPKDVHSLQLRYNVEQFPALIVVNGNQIIFFIEGKKNKEQIVNPILMKLSTQ